MITRRVMMQAAGVAGLGLMVPSLQASQDVRNDNKHVAKRLKDYQEAIECAKKPEVSIAIDRVTSEITNRLNLKLFNNICPKIQLPQAWEVVKQLLILGDCFLERGFRHSLPPSSMWKIVTTNGKVIQYQQGVAPDYQSVVESTRSKTNIVFQPSQIKHLLFNTIWMYGVTSVFVLERNETFGKRPWVDTREELEEDLIQWYVKDLTKQLERTI